MSDLKLLAFHDWLVDLRRELHQIPELCYKEEKTAAKICQVLDELQIPYQTQVGGTGVVARLTSRKKGPLVAYRADMDALPLEESNDLPYKSKHPGMMHACGHDGHVSTTGPKTVAVKFSFFSNPQKKAVREPRPCWIPVCLTRNR
jgi:amidohydrolase